MFKNFDSSNDSEILQEAGDWVEIDSCALLPEVGRCHLRVRNRGQPVLG